MNTAQAFALGAVFGVGMTVLGNVVGFWLRRRTLAGLIDDTKRFQRVRRAGQ